MKRASKAFLGALSKSRKPSAAVQRRAVKRQTMTRRFNRRHLAEYRARCKAAGVCRECGGSSASERVYGCGKRRLWPGVLCGGCGQDHRMPRVRCAGCRRAESERRRERRAA